MAEKHPDQLNRNIFPVSKGNQPGFVHNNPALLQVALNGHLCKLMITEIAQSRRDKTPLSILMIDIDYFKTINDVYGHDVGDVVLKNLSFMLKTSIRVNDFICRYGGEEFVVVNPNSSLTGTSILAEKLKKSAKEEGIEIKQSLEY